MKYPIYFFTGNYEFQDAAIVLVEVDQIAGSMAGIRDLWQALAFGVLLAIVETGWGDFLEGGRSGLPYPIELVEDIQSEDVKFLGEIFGIPVKEHYRFLIRQYFLVNYYTYLKLAEASLDDEFVLGEFDHHPGIVWEKVLNILRESGIENVSVPRLFFLCSCAFVSWENKKDAYRFSGSTRDRGAREKRQANRIEKILNQLDDLIEKEERTGLINLLQEKLASLRREIKGYIDVYARFEEATRDLSQQPNALPDECVQAHEGIAQMIEKAHSPYWKADDASRILEAWGVQVNKDVVRQRRRRRQK